MKQDLLKELDSVQKFFERSTSTLTEADSKFVAAEGMLSVAHQVAHAAQSIDWFIDGMTSPAGFDLDFSKHWEEIGPCGSLTEARRWFSDSIAKAKSAIAEMSEQQLAEPLPDGPVMGGAPKYSVIGSLADHTAHHRGALTVYARLLGREPKMPYMD